MKLSKRLQAVADMIPECNILADVGTDHGHIPIYAVQNRLCSHAFAMDINQGPLDRAMNNISAENLSDAIECRLSDGLDRLGPDEADCVVIAGMGGDLICNILSSKLNKNECYYKTLILSPHTHVEKVRRLLRTSGYCICNENMVVEEEKFYNIIKAEYTGQNHEDTELNDYFGEILINQSHPVLLQFLNKELVKYKDIPQKAEYLKLVINGVDQTVAAAQTKECR